MKMRFEFPDTTPTGSPPRGAAPVGHLHALPPIELAAIVYLRAWCDGGANREIIAKDFCLVMGDAAGAQAVGDFDALMTTLLNNARRPVMRHRLNCKCFGGIESAFANMIAAATGQDRDDAMLFANILMTGHAAWAAVQLVGQLGQVFLRLGRVPDRSPTPTHASQPTIHRH